MRKSKPSVVLKVTLFDRHAEHAVTDAPLCPHDKVKLYPSDTLKFDDEMFPSLLDGSSLPLVEINYVAPGKIEVILNHMEYRYAKHALDQAVRRST